MKQMTGDGQLCTMLLHQTWIESKNSLAQISFGGMTREGEGLLSFLHAALWKQWMKNLSHADPEELELPHPYPGFSILLSLCLIITCHCPIVSLLWFLGWMPNVAVKPRFSVHSKSVVIYFVISYSFLITTEMLHLPSNLHLLINSSHGGSICIIPVVFRCSVSVCKIGTVVPNWAWKLFQELEERKLDALDMFGF